MKRPFPIQIAIPSPCHEDWNKMTPTDKGRFCASCQKQVIDFTQWSDKELYEFFNKQQSKVCGRFRATQLNRPIAIPYQPHSRLYRLAIAAGLTLLFAQPVMAQQKSKAPLITQQAQNTNKKDKHTNIIEGVVLDSVTRRPMPHALVTLVLEEEKIRTAYTDNNGHYSISCDNDYFYDIMITTKNYRQEIIYNIYVLNDVVIVNVQLLPVTKDKTPHTTRYENKILTGEIAVPRQN